MNFQVKLRALSINDAKLINDLRNNTVYEQMIGGEKRFIPYERDLKWVENLIFNYDHSKFYFTVSPNDSDEFIGYTSISDIDYRNGSCFWSGIKIIPSKAGKGIATEVANLVLDYVFNELRMERCKAECLENHAAALKMMLKVGFVQEGLMRSSVFKNGIHNNQWLLSILKDEYFQIKSNLK
jgi:[ribosomal protein S5]-alanine N-acetyltransferase